MQSHRECKACVKYQSRFCCLTLSFTLVPRFVVLCVFAVTMAPYVIEISNWKTHPDFSVIYYCTSQFFRFSNVHMPRSNS